MRKIILFLGIIIIGCNNDNKISNTTSPVTYMDELLKEKPDSLLTENDENGKLLSKCYYKAGLKHGYCEFYYANGQIEKEGCYYKGNPIGLFTYYNEDSSVKEMREYEIVHGKSEINQFQFFDESDNIIDEKSNYITVVAKKDTVELGDKYSLRIKLEAPYFKSKMDVVIGNFDREYKLVDSVNYTVQSGNNFVVDYGIETKQVGQNVIRGYVRDYKEYDDSDTVRASRNIYFTKVFFVKE